MMETDRYTAVALPRKIRKFSAVVVDNRHPSGCPNVIVRYYATMGAARAEAASASAQSRSREQAADLVPRPA